MKKVKDPKPKVEFTSEEQEFFKEYLDEFTVLKQGREKESFLNGRVVPDMRKRWPDKFSRATTDSGPKNKAVFKRVKKVSAKPCGEYARMKSDCSGHGKLVPLSDTEQKPEEGIPICPKGISPPGGGIGEKGGG